MSLWRISGRSWLLSMIGAALVAYAPAGEATTVRLLTVGNSFAYNATKFLPDLAKAAGDSLVMDHANYSGCSLEKHWAAAQAAEEADSGGAIYPPREPAGPRRTLREILQSGTWDVVTIQQASRLSDEPSTYEPFAQLLRDYINLHAPGAEIVFHETWAYRADDDKFAKGGNPAEMHRAVREAYRLAASRLGLRVIPVGSAFHLASSRAEWTYVPDPAFDRNSVKFPEEPPQPGSLHKGWSWIKKADGSWTFWLDSTHANIFGSYLGSCVFFESLFGKSPVGNSFVPEGISPAQARSLQEIAHEAVSLHNSKSAPRGIIYKRTSDDAKYDSFTCPLG